MIDFLGLLKDTNAIKTVKSDLKNDKLSHAYLLVCNDEVYLSEYLKVLSKIILASGDLSGRIAKMIDEGAYSDLLIYPKNGDKVLTEDIAELINETYYKPTEGETKLFLIDKAHTMLPQVQNKLLKTLEEPPKGVCILLGTTSEYPLLATIKSRVKRIEITSFQNAEIFNALKTEFSSFELLNSAIECGNGTLGKAYELCSDQNFKEIYNLCVDIAENMKSSVQILDYAEKIASLKCEPQKFLEILAVCFQKMLKNSEKGIKIPEGYKRASILNALEKITVCEKRLFYNSNPQMVMEWLLFQILEGKYKWLKL